MLRRFGDLSTSFDGTSHPCDRIVPTSESQHRGPVGFPINVAVPFREIG